MRRTLRSRIMETMNQPSNKEELNSSETRQTGRLNTKLREDAMKDESPS